MNNSEKIKAFEDSCRKMLREEASELTNSIDNEIESQIKTELEEYERKEKITYDKKIEKIEKEYNKTIYNLELANKKEILEKKKEIKLEIKNEVTKILKDFTNKYEYKDFLMKNIYEAMQKITNRENAGIGLVNKDLEKYGHEVYEKFHVILSSIDDKYIGGCIVENKVDGIYIDNTIKNSISEKLEI